MQSSFDVALIGFPQPDWNNAQSVADALRAIQDANSKEASSRACHKLLYSVGNNHAGTYYPVVLVAVPALAAILHEGSFWARHAALNVLVELCGSFEPEPEFLDFEGAPLSSALMQKVAVLVPLVERLATETDAVGQSARDLVDATKDAS
ncbi:MAG TPA: hypothetical protein VF457_13165 [Burkholderiaceae bacterium]